MAPFKQQLHDIAGTPEAIRGLGVTNKSRDVSGTEAQMVGQMGGGRIGLNNIAAATMPIGTRKPQRRGRALSARSLR